MNGWIKLHRKMLDNPLTKKPLWAWLWVVLLLRVNHEDKAFIWNGELQDIKAGSFIAGRKSLAEESGLSESMVERALNYMEKIGQIGQQKNNKFRLITLPKWQQYQVSEQQMNNQRTTSEQPVDTNKKLKKEKKVKKGIAGETPATQARSFFEKGTAYTEILDTMAQTNDRNALEFEFGKFIVYWTEKNKSGTKERWEQQPTFEVKRRLFTWLSNVRAHRGAPKGKGIIGLTEA